MSVASALVHLYCHPKVQGAVKSAAVVAAQSVLAPGEAASPGRTWSYQSGDITGQPRRRHSHRRNLCERRNRPCTGGNQCRRH